MTARLYLVRHGETTWSLSGQHTGQINIPLTPHGEDEARQLRPLLERVTFSAVFTSPRLPKGVEGGSGDLLFLANHGKIVAAASILGIDRPNLNDDMDYLEQGSPDDPESYNYIRAGKIYRIENSPPYRGHTGIRYVDRLKDAKLRKFLQKTAKGLRDKLPIK